MEKVIPCKWKQKVSQGNNTLSDKIDFKTKIVKKRQRRTLQTNSEKEIRFMVIRGKGEGEGELDEGNQKVKTSSYKINKY